MRRFACLAAMLLVGVLAFGASTASAGTVSWFGGCYQNGTATTTAGPLQLKFGWFTQRIGQLQQFFGVQYVTYQIQGSAPVSTGVGSQLGWTKPAPAVNGETPPKSGYVSYYTTPVIASLSSGQSITVSLSLTTTSVTRDSDAGNPIPAGTLFGGTCTITAS
jgi:hypothetical protein